MEGTLRRCVGCRDKWKLAPVCYGFHAPSMQLSLGFAEMRGANLATNEQTPRVLCGYRLLDDCCKILQQSSWLISS